MNKLGRVFREPVIIQHGLDLLFSPLRLLGLRLMAWWSGGQCEFASGVQIKHRVVFQGRGRLVVEKDAVFGYPLAGALGSPVLLQPREREAIIHVGKRSAVMNGCELIARTSISIGADCLIGPHTLIYDADFHGLHPDERRTNGVTIPVIISDNVWIGARVTILKGVSIGRDAVLAAGAVVTKDVPEGAVVAGNPARQIASVYDLDGTAIPAAH